MSTNDPQEWDWDTVPLTGRMERVLASRDPDPETALLLKEAGGFEEPEEESSRRRLSPALYRMLLCLAADDPSRVTKLLDWALPIEEAYLVRRYLMRGETSASIAADVGLTGAGVRYRLRRAMWRLRSVQELAWDLSAREIRAALSDAQITERDLELLVTFWDARFSQSRTAERLKRRQSAIREALARIARSLKGAEGKDAKRICRTLFEVQRRKLWTIATPLPLKHALRLPF